MKDVRVIELVELTPACLRGCAAAMRSNATVLEEAAATLERAPQLGDYLRELVNALGAQTEAPMQPAPAVVDARTSGGSVEPSEVADTVEVEIDDDPAPTSGTVDEDNEDEDELPAYEEEDEEEPEELPPPKKPVTKSGKPSAKLAALAPVTGLHDRFRIISGTQDILGRFPDLPSARRAMDGFKPRRRAILEVATGKMVSGWRS